MCTGSAPPFLAAIEDFAGPFRTVNSYGLFRVMTRERTEIIIEGSEDGVSFQPYEFKWKPGDVKRRPEFSTPIMPRLDWAMWFAALDPETYEPPLGGLISGLLRGEQPVVKLLETDPFAGKAPQFIRVTRYDYQFTSSAERRRSGAWWKRTEIPGSSRTFSKADLNVQASQ